MCEWIWYECSKECPRVLRFSLHIKVSQAGKAIKYRGLISSLALAHSLLDKMQIKITDFVPNHCPILRYTKTSRA